MPRGLPEENALNIYADGSSFGSPRRGGLGVRFVLINDGGDEIVQDIDFPGYKGATNNQMELKACVLALEEAIRLHLVDRVAKVLIYSDSLYVASNYKKAMFEWRKAKWRTSSGRPVLNADLWKQLISEMKAAGKRVDIKWVKGHSKSIHNRAADRMARRSATLPVGKPLSLVHVRRKLSPGQVDIGCVVMRGQTVMIRIITAEYLRLQRLWKAKYEVITKDSPDFESVDVIFSASLLAAGHSYLVELNKDTKNPRVVKVFHEIGKGTDVQSSAAQAGPPNNSLEPTLTARENGDSNAH